VHITLTKLIKRFHNSKLQLKTFIVAANGIKLLKMILINYEIIILR